MKQNNHIIDNIKTEFRIKVGCGFFIKFYTVNGEKYPATTESRPDLPYKVFAQRETAEKYLEIIESSQNCGEIEELPKSCMRNKL